MTVSRRIDLEGASFFVADGKDGFWDRYEAAAWEPETLAALRSMVGPGTLLIDLGGWIGPITLLAAALGARVLAFEPDPRAHELLALNIAANPAFAGRISLHNLALAPEAGRLKLGSPKKPGDSMGSILAAESGQALWEADAITPETVAQLASGAERIVLKIDIEGAEYALLPNLRPLLGGRTVGGLVAFHPRLLEKAGWSAEAIEAASVTAEAALAGFDLIALDGVDGELVSRHANTTVHFKRRAS